jgi:hypothetical protein
MPPRKIGHSRRARRDLGRPDGAEETKVDRQSDLAPGSEAGVKGGRALERLAATGRKQAYVEVSEGVASAAERARLQLGSAERVYRLRRVRVEEGGELVAERAVLPAALFPGLGDKRDLERGIVELAAAYGLELGMARERVFLGSASHWASEGLGLARLTPVLVLDRVVLTGDRRPAEWRIVERNAPSDPGQGPSASGKRRQG